MTKFFGKKMQKNVILCLIYPSFCQIVSIFLPKIPLFTPKSLWHKICHFLGERLLHDEITT